MAQKKKSEDFFAHPVRLLFVPHCSTIKQAVQLDLSLDHVPRAAAFAQKGKSGGAASNRRYIYEENVLLHTRWRHLVCMRELAEANQSYRGRCESTVRWRFASLFCIALGVGTMTIFNQNS